MRALAAALLSAVLTGCIGAGIATLLSLLPSYGWSLFLGLPCLLGVFCAVLMNLREPSPAAETQAATMLSLLFAGGALLTWRMEGMICLFMAAPLAIPLALTGAALGRAVCRTGQAPRNHAALLLVPLLAVPAGSFERAWQTAPAARPVVTSIDIEAPPELVWRHVVSFPDLPPPSEWYFQAGLAYPLRARIEGTGVDSIRYCEFSTGAFVEPIEIWDEPRLLRFAVTENPAPMKELNPFGAVHAHHLNGFLVSEAGQFRLVPLDGGRRTRLEGTTWYRHGLWPEAYWRLWSDAIIHRIHRRVLSHIAALAETGTSLFNPGGGSGATSPAQAESLPHRAA